MKLIEQLKFEEGLRLKKYLCPKGHWTIGYGHNLDASPYLSGGEKISNEITESIAEEILRIDIGTTLAKLRESWPRFDEFDKSRRDAFANMAFQLGVSGFMRFERMRAAALARDWETAYKEALNSNWARYQSTERARRVAWQIKNGKYYEVPA